MKIKSNKGFTGIDIAISVIVLFIFVSLIAVLVYNNNSSSQELELKTEATYLAIDEIEKIKNNGFEKYESLNKDSTQDEDGNPLNQSVPVAPDTEEFYKTITVKDYTDIEGNEGKIPNLVKQVTVKITYMFKAQEQSVELTTILSKD